jgi:hypothetical protein
VLFLANNDRERAHAVDISLGWENIGAVTRLDLLTGESAPQRIANGGFADTIGPADSRLYLIEAASSQGSVPESGPVREEFFTSSCRVHGAAHHPTP